MQMRYVPLNLYVHFVINAKCYTMTREYVLKDRLPGKCPLELLHFSLIHVPGLPRPVHRPLDVARSRKWVGGAAEIAFA